MANQAVAVVVNSGTPMLNGHEKRNASLETLTGELAARHVLPDSLYRLGASQVPSGLVMEEPANAAIQRFLEHVGSTPKRAVQWSELYPVSETGRSALIIRALTLLDDGEKTLAQALECSKDDDVIGADFEVTKFQGTLPELFCCNSISESFATVVVALRWALKNRQGDPLGVEQMRVVLETTGSLKKQLFMEYDRALDLIEKLEAVGLNTDASVAAPLETLILDTSNEHQEQKDSR